MLHDNSELFLFIKANEPYVCEQINDRPELDWACFGGNKMKSEMKNNNVWPVVLGEDSSLDRPLKERCIITSVSLPAPRSHKPHLVCSDFSSVHLLALLMIQWCDCWKTSQAFWMNPLVYRCVCACVCVCLWPWFSADLCSTTWLDLVMGSWWVLGEIGKRNRKKTVQQNPTSVRRQ